MDRRDHGLSGTERRTLYLQVQNANKVADAAEEDDAEEEVEMEVLHLPYTCPTLALHSLHSLNCLKLPETA